MTSNAALMSLANTDPSKPSYTILQNPQPSTAAHAQPALQPLPATQTFDILPLLHELLARLDHSLPQTASTSDTGHYAELQPLEPKDVPTLALPVKARIRKALRELEKVPGVERSVAEQEEEIAELEARIERQRAVLRGLSEAAGKAGGAVGRGG